MALLDKTFHQAYKCFFVHACPFFNVTLLYNSLAKGGLRGISYWSLCNFSSTLGLVIKLNIQQAKTHLSRYLKDIEW